MSFKEKSIWISLVTTILIFGYYFLRIFQMANNEEATHTEIAVFFISVIVLIVIVETILHILLAIFHRPEAEDERDRLIELKATRNAYYLLVAGVFTAIVGFVVSAAPILVAHIILFFFILAETGAFITQLFYYRRGI